MIWKIMTIIFFYLIGFLFISISTYKDFLMFKDRKTRKKVATNISPNMPDKEIMRLFFKQNLWEMTFFWIGLTLGIVTMWVL